MPFALDRKINILLTIFFLCRAKGKAIDLDLVAFPIN